MAASVPNWLQRLQEQALAGRFTDVIVRLHLPRNDNNDDADAAFEQAPAKRPRRGRSKKQQEEQEQEQEQEAAAAQQPATRVVAEVPCLGAVLSARSPYFRSSLQGEWREAQTRTVDITLDDEQAVADFKLLLKLSYTSSYTRDGGALLDRKTRVRLAALADAYEMEDCVMECLSSLADGISLEEALGCLYQVPYRLEGHAGFAVLKEKLIALVAGEINTRSAMLSAGQLPATEAEASRKLIKDAATRLAMWLGPVSGFFGEGPCVHPLDMGYAPPGYFNLLPLKPAIRDLGPYALEALLASDALRCDSENEPFHLFAAWFAQSPRCPLPSQQKLALVPTLACHLRFEHMDAAFLGAVVASEYWVNDAGLLPAVMHAALVYRGQHARTLSRGVAAPRPRALPTDCQVWTVRTSVFLGDCLRLTTPGRLCQTDVALVAGHVARLSVTRMEAERASLGLTLVMPFWEPPPLDGATPWLGRTLHIVLEAGGGRWDAKGAGGSIFFAISDPWADFTREGGAYFKGGKMVVTATVRVLTDKEPDAV